MKNGQYLSDKPCRMPKAIVDHPAVEEVGYGPSEAIEGYRYAVWLKEDWRFTRGRMTDCRSGNFNTVADFVYARPTKRVP